MCHSDEPPDDLLERIARDKLGVPTLAVRKSDRLDFHEVYVASLKEALALAFVAGVASELAREKAAAP